MFNPFSRKDLGKAARTRIERDKPKKKPDLKLKAAPAQTKSTREPSRKERKEAERADARAAFRWGTFDESGYVNPVMESASKKDFDALRIPGGTKPFLFPTSKEFVAVYLRAPDGKKLLPAYSRDGRWLCAEKLYSAFEKNASFSGKVNEFFHRVGEIKESMKGEFSLKGNLFIVLLVLFGGIAIAYGVAKALWFP